MTNDFGSLFQIGTGVGVIITGIWSRVEAKRAKEAAQGAKTQADQIRAAVQPNGDSLATLVEQQHQILGKLTEIAEANNFLNKQGNRLLIQLITHHRYQRRRNHAIINGLYRLALGNATLLRHFGIDVPDPLPPMPDEFRTPEQEGPLDELR